jgi:hypothetical protein
MSDPIAALEETGAGAVTVVIEDEGGEVARLDLPGETSVGELSSQASVFGQPPGEYALYSVNAGPDGRESVTRISPMTKLDEIETPEGELPRLRFAPALKGAR